MSEYVPLPKVPKNKLVWAFREQRPDFYGMPEPQWYFGKEVYLWVRYPEDGEMYGPTIRESYMGEYNLEKMADYLTSVGGWGAKGVMVRRLPQTRPERSPENSPPPR